MVNNCAFHTGHDSRFRLQTAVADSSRTGSIGTTTYLSTPTLRGPSVQLLRAGYVDYAIVALSRHFSTSHFAQFPHKKGTRREDRNVLPELVIRIQSPLQLLKNKWHSFLVGLFDPGFNMDEFREGACKAAGVICNYVSEEKFSSLESLGLMTEPAIRKFRSAVSSLNKDQLKYLQLEMNNFLIVKPRRIRYEIQDQTITIDVFFTAVKKNDNSTGLIELVLQFRKCYSGESETEGWTATNLGRLIIAF